MSQTRIDVAPLDDAAKIAPAMRVISGIGGKCPACFLVKAGSTRLLLDLGEGPEPGVRPDISLIDGAVDAILLSHAHEDHANALDLRQRLGSPPVYATRGTWDLLPETLVPLSERRILPDHGCVGIAGIEVSTGRCGHAPGGIWIHLAVGDGLLYTGDFTVESQFYPFDPPPRAGTIIVDASYGDHDESLASQIDEIASLAASGAVLPVPEGGRGPEMALQLVERGLPVPYLCKPIQQQIRRIVAGEDSMVSASVRTTLSRVFATGFADKPAPNRVTICADSNCVSGLSAELLATWDKEVPFIFTGHVPRGTPASKMLQNGEARWVRWNVHPRRSDVVALVDTVGARQVVLAFVDPASARTLNSELSDRTVVGDADIDLTITAS